MAPNPVHGSNPLVFSLGSLPAPTIATKTDDCPLFRPGTLTHAVLGPHLSRRASLL